MSQRLDEISLLRPITIGLLVVMHAFTMYAGNWSLPEGIMPVRAYFWVQKLSFGCMLEMFVFISGYIFGYQLFGQKRIYRFGELAVNKLRRLIVPSMLFSLLYILCFSTMVANHQWVVIVYNTLAGYAHMWFLPMLFWCFLGAWALVRSGLSSRIILLGLLLLSIFSRWPLPLQLNSACYYLLFFYLGIYLYQQRERLMNWVSQHASAIYIAFSAYILVLVLQTLTIEDLNASIGTGLSDRILHFALVNACKISYALPGVMILYILALRYTTHHALSSFTNDVNRYCFAIYIIQQFILEVLYYHTALPILVGSYWLPWIGTFGTLVLSYLLARLLLLTRTGKFLF